MGIGKWQSQQKLLILLLPVITVMHKQWTRWQCACFNMGLKSSCETNLSMWHQNYCGWFLLLCLHTYLSFYLFIKTKIKEFIQAIIFSFSFNSVTNFLEKNHLDLKWLSVHHSFTTCCAPTPQLMNWNSSFKVNKDYLSYSMNFFSLFAILYHLIPLHSLLLLIKKHLLSFYWSLNYGLELKI